MFSLRVVRALPAIALFALLLAAPTAQAHQLTCSTDPNSHRHQIESEEELPEFKGDVSGAKCEQVVYDQVRYVVKRHGVWRCQAIKREWEVKSILPDGTPDGTPQVKTSFVIGALRFGWRRCRILGRAPSSTSSA